MAASFVVSVSLSARMEQLGSQKTYFREICNIFRKSVVKFKFH